MHITHVHTKNRSCRCTVHASASQPSLSRLGSMLKRVPIPKNSECVEECGVKKKSKYGAQIKVTSPCSNMSWSLFIRMNHPLTVFVRRKVSISLQRRDYLSSYSYSTIWVSISRPKNLMALPLSSLTFSSSVNHRASSIILPGCNSPSGNG